MPDTAADARRTVVDLSRRLGDPAADLVILGEGNTSVALPDGSFLVKASGASLHRAVEDDFVRLDRAAVLDLVADGSLDEHDIAGLAGRLRDAGSGGVSRTPSIETMLHALALDLPGAAYVGHTHPTAINALLCSQQAEDLLAEPLFPDQVVVCGRHTLFVPYAEPGLPLARAVRDGLRAHADRHGVAPKLIYLGNHGIVAVGASASEVEQITAMSVKAARVLAGTSAGGGPRPLPPASADRLDRRPVEAHRRRVLAGAGTPPAAGPPDAGSPAAGPPDAGSPAAGPPDAGSPAGSTSQALR